MDLLQQDISKLLGIDDMPEAEQALFLNDIGSLLLEGALMKFVLTLTDDEQTALEVWSDQPPTEAMLPELLERFPAFETFLTDEIHSFKADAVRILSTVAPA